MILQKFAIFLDFFEFFTIFAFSWSPERAIVRPPGYLVVKLEGVPPYPPPCPWRRPAKEVNIILILILVLASSRRA